MDGSERRQFSKCIARRGFRSTRFRSGLIAFVHFIITMKPTILGNSEEETMSTASEADAAARSSVSSTRPDGRNSVDQSDAGYRRVVSGRVLHLTTRFIDLSVSTPLSNRRLTVDRLFFVLYS